MRKIMSKFYEFKNMFRVALHIFSFPGIVFFIYNIKSGWQKWYRPWRNNLIHFGGWIILKNWVHEFKKGLFLEKLRSAQQHLKEK